MTKKCAGRGNGLQLRPNSFYPLKLAGSLKKLFLEELVDRLDSEKQLVHAIPKLEKLATCKVLQEHFQAHLKKTEEQVKKLETLLKSFDTKAGAKKCAATVGILKEGDELAADFKGSPALNAALISIAQKVEHYAIASYGCLHSWATALKQNEAAAVLEEILKEEKAENDSFIELAQSCCNQEGIAGGKEAKTSGADKNKKAPEVQDVIATHPIKAQTSHAEVIKH